MWWEYFKAFWAVGMTISAGIWVFAICTWIISGRPNPGKHWSGKVVLSLLVILFFVIAIWSSWVSVGVQLARFDKNFARDFGKQNKWIATIINAE